MQNKSHSQHDSVDAFGLTKQKAAATSQLSLTHPRRAFQSKHQDSSSTVQASLRQTADSPTEQPTNCSQLYVNGTDTAVKTEIAQ